MRVGDLVRDTTDGEILIIVKIREETFGPYVLCYCVAKSEKYWYDKYNIHYLEVINDEDLLWKVWGDK